MIIECPSKRLFDKNKMVFTDNNEFFSNETLNNIFDITDMKTEREKDKKLKNLSAKEKTNVADFVFLLRTFGDGFIADSAKKIDENINDLQKQKDLIFEGIKKNAQQDLGGIRLKKKSSCSIM